MGDGKKINSVVIYLSSDIRDLFKNGNWFGFSKKLFSIIVSRFESRQLSKTSHLTLSNSVVFYKTLLDIVPESKDIKIKNTFNIFMLDVVNSYRGSRHSLGLPTRGQRTWTNAWSAYKSNLILRQYKISLLKRLHTTITINDLTIAYLAEQVNNLWRLQWQEEWKKAKKQRQDQAKRTRHSISVDLKAMALGNVTTKDKKNKNYIIGFDPGFTKYILRQSIKLSFKNKN